MSGGQKNDIPMFLAKLWNLVEDPQTDSLIHWNSTGKSFIVHDPGTFSKVLLPQYFKHRNMASFIRVLNMYGFRKVVNLDSGSLQSFKDEMEFQHPCFVRGNEQLLIHIKRKLSSAPTQVQKGLTAINGSSAENRNPDPEATKIYEEVRSLRAKQESMQQQFDELKRENEAVWNQLEDVRSKHSHQQMIINKLIEFFITLLHSTGHVSNTVLRAAPQQLAIQNASSEMAPVSNKRPRLEKDSSSNHQDYHGPIIRDVTDEWSNFNQSPHDADWDRLLALDDDILASAAGPLTSAAASLSTLAANGSPRPRSTGVDSAIGGAGVGSQSQPGQNFGVVTSAPPSPLSTTPALPGVIMTPAKSAAATVSNALTTTFGSQAGLPKDTNSDSFSAQMETDVNTMQSSLDIIKNLLQNPSYNLDLSHILQLFPPQNGLANVTNGGMGSNGMGQMSQQGLSPLSRSGSVGQMNMMNPNAAHSPSPVHRGNEIVEYHPNLLNLEDNLLLGMDDGDDFLGAFANLPHDDMIEGVTINIPDYSSSATELGIPISTADSTVMTQTFTQSQPVMGSPSQNGGKRKRKTANPLKA